jgi:hypothetical protein
MAADESAAKMFANGMKLGGVLSTTRSSPDQRKDIREDMIKQFSGDEPRARPWCSRRA